MDNLNFRGWCQKVLPLVYDDSLSYYELLCKMIKYIKDAIDIGNINAKDMKDQYGKYLIIGLGTLYIIQSIANILMNINMGVKTSIILPFVSDADVYYVINILCMAIMLSVYRRKDINFEEPKKSKLVVKIEDFLFEEV